MQRGWMMWRKGWESIHWKLSQSSNGLGIHGVYGNHHKVQMDWESMVLKYSSDHFPDQGFPQFSTHPNDPKARYNKESNKTVSHEYSKPLLMNTQMH